MLAVSVIAITPALNTSSLVVRNFEGKLCAPGATAQLKVVKFRNGPGKSGLLHCLCFVIDVIMMVGRA
jgi:hypothetical protein